MKSFGMYVLACFAVSFMCTSLNYQSKYFAADGELKKEQRRIVQLKSEIQSLKNELKKPVAQIIIEPTSIPKGISLAYKNKNLLNVKSIKGRWQGQIGTDKYGHAIFRTWEHGIRAASLTLKNYAKRHKICTVRGIIERFAEGNQVEYINYLCRNLGVAPDEKINLIAHLPQLLRHMARWESGSVPPEHLFVAYDVLATL